MQIDIISIGQNKLNIIKLIREYSGLSLKEAKDRVDKVPSSFIASVPDDMMFEIESRFTEEGAIIVIKTGIGTPKEKKIINPIAKAVFSESKEKKEPVELKNRTEIINYLKTNQNKSGAIRAAVISSLVLIVGVIILMQTMGMFHWSYKFIFAAVIGFAVRKSGKGVTTNFGVIALFATLITIFLSKFGIFLFWALRSGDLSYLSMVFQPNIFGLLTSLVACLLAFQLAFIRVTEQNKNRIKSQIGTVKSTSDIINQRREEMTNKFSQNKTSSPTVFTQEVKPLTEFEKEDKDIERQKKTQRKKTKKRRNKDDRRNNVIPGADKQKNKF